jgi:probable rRNA maturation factor
MLEVAIDADEEWDSSGFSEQLIRQAAEAAIAESGFPQLATDPRSVEISILLAGDDKVRDLNAEYRGKHTPTNVLSFPMVDPDDLRDTNVAEQELLLGDIILALGVCEAEAADKGVSVEQHAAHLLIHGTLHLLGFDHHGDNEAADMEAREIRALARLGIANPYERAA